MRVGSKTNGFELGIPNGYIYHIYFSRSLTYAYNGNVDSVYQTVLLAKLGDRQWNLD